MSGKCENCDKDAEYMLIKEDRKPHFYCSDCYKEEYRKLKRTKNSG